MKLEGDGSKLYVILDDGARILVPNVALSPRQVAPLNYSGDRAWWTEVSLHADGDAFVLRIAFVLDHEGGTDRDRADFHRSSDGGKTWTPASEMKTEGAPLAFLAT